jgi:hypothetical protein
MFEMIVKAEGPSGRAKINSDDPKHALGLVQYLRTIVRRIRLSELAGESEAVPASTLPAARNESTTFAESLRAVE